MEMSNLPQYNVTWGDRNNKEMAATRYMAAIVWYFLKREMCGTAPNVGNMANCFSQLKSAVTPANSKKVQERAWWLCPKEEKNGSGR